MAEENPLNPLKIISWRQLVLSSVQLSHWLKSPVSLCLSVIPLQCLSSLISVFMNSRHMCRFFSQAESFSFHTDESNQIFVCTHTASRIHFRSERALVSDSKSTEWLPLPALKDLECTDMLQLIFFYCNSNRDFVIMSESTEIDAADLG